MSALLATFGRELRAYFLSPLSYGVLFFFLVANGCVFAYILWASLANPAAASNMQPFALFFGFGVWWQIGLVPLLTMRLLAEERRSGSIEVLMTAPVTEGQVVTGKFLAALVFYAFLWTPVLVYALFVEVYGEVDWGMVGGGLFGMLLLGGLFLALGMVASALSRSQLLAAFASVAVVILFLLLSGLSLVVTSQIAQDVLAYVSVFEHVDEFSRGIVDSRRLVFYLSGAAFFLFVAARTLEERKWR